jgi:hypothetical protein
VSEFKIMAKSWDLGKTKGKKNLMKKKFNYTIDKGNHFLQMTLK